MSRHFLNVAADMFEQGQVYGPQLPDDDDGESYAAPVWQAAEALAVVLDLFRKDPAYAHTIGISRRGLDYLHGAESVLNGATINHDL